MLPPIYDYTQSSEKCPDYIYLPRFTFEVEMSEKGGVDVKGVAFITVLAVSTVLAVLHSSLPSSRLSCKIPRPGGNHDGFESCLTRQAIRTPTFRSFARIWPRIRANRVFSPIRIEIRVIRVLSSLLSIFWKVDSQKKEDVFFEARIESRDSAH